jgi:SAM-dependent methyltransferase
MSGRVIDPAGFEAKYRENIDPWNYAASPFEAFKRRVLLRACGTPPFGRALELACGTGATSRALAPRCLRLVAQDSSPTAIAEALRRGGPPGLAYEVGLLPADMPRGPFDLIVASGILYYLSRPDLARTLDRIEAALAPGGRVVVLHHVVDFADAAVRPRLAQALAVARFGRWMVPAFHLDAGRFQAAAYVRPTPASVGTARGMRGRASAEPV